MAKCVSSKTGLIYFVNCFHYKVQMFIISSLLVQMFMKNMNLKPFYWERFSLRWNLSWTNFQLENQELLKAKPHQTVLRVLLLTTTSQSN